MASERLKTLPIIIGRIRNRSGETGGVAAVTMKVCALYDNAAEKRVALVACGDLLASIVSMEG